MAATAAILRFSASATSQETPVYDEKNEDLP